MKNGSTIVAAFFLFCLLHSAPVLAEPVAITGFATINLTRLPRGSVELEGPNGFTFVGDIGSSAASPECLVCIPGEELRLRAAIVGTDLVGAVTIGGESFRVGSLNSEYGSLALEFVGSGIVPPLGGTTATVTAPIMLFGSLSFPTAGGRSTPPFSFTGTGMAKAFLTWPPSPDILHGWTVSRVEYRLGETLGAVPEPASIVLVTTGIVGLALRRRQKRKTDPEAV